MIQTVLVTGVAGFIGRTVARYFGNLGFKIVGVDCVPHESIDLPDYIKYHQLTLPCTELEVLLKDCSPAICVHCAGRASVAHSISDPAPDFHAGPIMTFELLNAIRHYANACRVIFLSSAAVYGNPESLPVAEAHVLKPVSPYGFHKLQSELICREFAQVYQLKVASLRIFSAYGAGLRRQVLWDIVRKVLSPGAIMLQGSGTESRDFVHVDDIARAIHQVASKADLCGEVYNVGSGVETSIATLVDLTINLLSVERVCEFDGRVPPGTPLNWCADISRLQSLGFRPTIPLSEGLANFVSWSKAEIGLRSVEPDR